MPQPAYLTGRRFGKLTVVSEHGKDNWGKSLWLCRCDCGRETIGTCTKLTRGKKRSCGCLLAEVNASMNRAPLPTGTAYVWAILGRLHRLAARLEKGEWITAMDLAGEEEVHAKSIYRAMDFFRDQLRWDIETSQFGFRLKEKGQELIRRKGKVSDCKAHQAGW